MQIKNDAQLAHGVISALKRRPIDVVTSIIRRFNIDITSCSGLVAR